VARRSISTNDNAILIILLLYLKIFGLIVLMLLSWLGVSLLFMLVPVWMGRQIFALWFDDNPKVYELYTSAMGLYTCLLLLRGTTLVAGWLQQGWAQLSHKLREWAVLVRKTTSFSADSRCLFQKKIKIGFENFQKIRKIRKKILLFLKMGCPALGIWVAFFKTA
jgi:hypothetical protein